MKSKLTKLVVFGFLAFFLVKCVATQATMLTSKYYPPISPKDVVIYLDKSDIKGEYEKVAIINAQGSSTWTNENKMYEAAKEKAAEIGANGLLLGKIEEPSSGEKIAGVVFGVPTSRRGQMIAIYVYKK